MENLQFLGAAIAFFAVGTGMILYEVARNKANRPILNGGNAIQLYYCGYLSTFVLGTMCVVAAMVK
jgi:divalent metal cation (Fe/Co/Zn/Cd) transporter